MVRRWLALMSLSLVCVALAPSPPATSDPVNQPPTVVDIAVSAPADDTVCGTISASDPDTPHLQPAISLLDPPAAGAAQVNADGTFTFTPPDNTADVFTFTVRACDQANPPACRTGRVMVTITPVAHPDILTTPGNTPVTVDVRSNDRGGVGLPTLTGPPESGSTVVEPDGRVTYTPALGFRGLDTFEYQVCALAQPSLCTTAQVVVTVGPAAPTFDRWARPG